MVVARELEVRVAHRTWPKGRPPPLSLIDVEGPVTVDMRAVLIETALRTAPPISRGFTLADSWAWLRYIPALNDSPQLRLRPEWTDLDPHQKTILSDDWGVGLVMHVIGDALGFTSVCHTGYLVSQLRPDAFALRRTGRRGPRKSPDYIAFDSSGRYHVVECKGTQTTRVNLTAQLETGVRQKGNVVCTLIPEGERLVAGCFVPQFESNETACLEIRDPAPEEPIKIDLAPERVLEVVAQGQLASELHAIGLPTLGNRVAQNERYGSDSDAAVRRELSAFSAREQPGGQRFLTRTIRTHASSVSEGRRDGYQIDLLLGFEEALINRIVQQVDEPIREIRRTTAEARTTDVHGARRESPFGVLVELEITRE